ncbi:MAG: hypothetical protein KDA58_11165 [Planctomycetaceae bacterium]|nr:hypothetical protein [Planctomycetaceae bacterium]
MYCPHCGQPVATDAADCQSCGERLPQLTRQSDVRREAIEIAQSEGKIAAIKFYRSETGCGLKEAKEQLESLLEEEGVELPSTGCLGMLLLAASLFTCGWLWA